MPPQAVVEALRMTNLGVKDWFTPFRDEAVIPYLALDED